MLKHFLRLFVQNNCYSCGTELTKYEKCLCLGCLAQIPSTNIEEKFSDNELYYRFAGKVPIHGAYSHFYFEKKGHLQKIMQQLKYEDAPQIGLFLGELIGIHLKESDFIQHVDAIIPVPLHKKKQIKRGYNQAERIAKGMSKELELPMMPKVLKRIKHTSTQTAMSRDARWENVAAAFEVVGEVPSNVLIVDDVITTGATIEACMRTLLASVTPPKEIRVASVGMARKM